MTQPRNQFTQLKQIKPKPADKKKLDDLSKKALKMVNEKVKKYKAKVMLVGSITRDTWLPDKKEFDIFILFPESMKKEFFKTHNLSLLINIMIRKELKFIFFILFI